MRQPDPSGSDRPLPRRRGPAWAALLALVALVAGCGGDPTPSGMPARTSTLDKIKRTGTITLATRKASIPFSYLDDAQHQAGYSWEIANRVADAVKQELQLDTLTVQTLVVTPQTRVQLVANQTVDLECSSTTHNREREAQVSFSSSFYITGSRMLVRKGSGIRDWTDLRGQRVVVSGGTTAERQLRKLNSDQDLDIDILLAKDISENFMMVETGRAAASVQDDIILFSNIARAKDPQAWEVVGAPLAREAYACMLRKGDVAFKTLVNSVIADMAESGELSLLYRKYFQSPIDVKGGINIDQPLSADMRELFRQPNDRIESSTPVQAAVEATTDYDWDWGILFRESVTGEGRYGAMFLKGLAWTLTLALIAWIIALALGIVLGVARTLPQRWLSWPAAVYVHCFRNIPLLVQLFLWYFVLPELLPPAWGNAIKQMNPTLNQALTVLLGLSLYTAAKVAEQVRSGIEAVPIGQRLAGSALGLRTAGLYRHVVLPQALRMVIPPLTSEFMNVFKNSAVALTIGLMELTGMSRQISEFSSHPFEVFTAATLAYMGVTLAVVWLMRSIESRTRVPGMLSA